MEATIGIGMLHKGFGISQWLPFELAIGLIFLVYRVWG